MLSHAPAAMRGFCAAHGVEPFLEMRAIGSASRPRHVCVIHLPLPRELHFDFGYSKLIRTGERSMRKKDAVLSATRVGAVVLLLSCDLKHCSAEEHAFSPAQALHR